MKINFLVPTTGITGGIKVIFQHANNLAKWGHDVTIIYPYVLDINASYREKIIGIIKVIRRIILLFINLDKIKWFDLDNKILISRAWNLSSKNLPLADVTIATANQTADWLVKSDEHCGKKYYFIQDYEIWTRNKILVDATWKMPLKKIVITKWLEKLAIEKFQEQVVGLVPDGVDLSKFYNQDKKINRNKKILMMYHPLEKKGFSDGLRAFCEVKKKYPEIGLTLFGAYPLKENVLDCKYYFQPNEEKLRELYSESDIFIWPSRVEGFGLPPMEAMACKCAVVSTDTGAIREYSVPDKTVLLVPPAQPALLAGKISILLDNSEKLKEISEASYNKIQEYDIRISSKKFEKILLN